MKQLFLVLAVSLLVSCSMDEEVFIFNGSERTESFKDMREKFELKRAAWERLGIQNYQLTRRFSWDALPYFEPMTFEISEGKSPVLINPELHPEEIANRPLEAIRAKSITEIFDMIDTAFSEIERIKRGERPRIRTLTFNIKYHPRYHFPMEYQFIVTWADRELTGSPQNELIVTEFIQR